METVDSQKTTPALAAARAACTSARLASIPPIPIGAEDERHRQLLSEHSGRQLELGDVAKHTLTQLDGVQVGDVGP